MSRENFFTRLLGWLFPWRSSDQKEHHPDEEDPMLEEAIRRCMATGKPVYGHRDKNGKVTFEDLD